MEAFGDINNLSSLLQDSREAQESRDSHYQQKPSTGGGKVVPKRGQATAVVAPIAAEKESNNKPKDNQSSGGGNDIWEETEIPSEEALMEVKDDRPAPRYEISYKQTVGTTDTFLGMSDKTPLTSDCTHLVVKIHFPGCKMSEINVDVKKGRILATSKTYRLFTYLPCEVDDKNGKAAFDSKKEVLSVTLPIINEFAL